MQTPLVYGASAESSLLYSCHLDGILSCYEPRTGKQLYKERLGTGRDGFTASPVACAGKIYFTSETGSVFVVKHGPKFSILATNQMGDLCMATPAISEGRMFFRTQSHVIAIGSRHIE